MKQKTKNAWAALLFLLLAACAAAGLTLAEPVRAAVSAPLGSVVVEAGKVTEDLLLTDEFTFGQPSAASCGQSPLAYKIAKPENDPRFALKMGTDVVYSAAETSLTLRRKFLSELTPGIYWLNFETAGGDREYVLDVRGVGNWAVTDGKGTVAAEGKHQTRLTLNGWTGNYRTDGRARYVLPLDVTKPIFLSMSNLTAGNWVMIGLNGDPYAAEYMDETERTPGAVKILSMARSKKTGEPERLQGFAGFLQTTGILPIGSYVNQTNVNVLEINIGETPAQSYVKVNGQEVEFGETTVRRSDFAKGKAYLNFYASEDVSFLVNNELNAPAAIFPMTRPEQEYTAKSAQDLVCGLECVDEADLALTYRGTALEAEQDYTYAAATKLLTIRGSYLKTLLYTDLLDFTVTSGGRSADVLFVTNLPETSGAALAAGEDKVRYFAGEDLAFRIDLKGETYLGVTDFRAGARVSAETAVMENGVLTFRAAAMRNWAAGTYEFLVETEQSLFPLIIVREDFVHSAADLSGGSNFAMAAGRLKVGAASQLLVREMFRLDQPLALSLAVREPGGWYLNGTAAGDAESCIEFRFTDLFSGNAVIVRVRANAAPDNSAVRFKTWVDFCLQDAAGNNLATQTKVFAKAETVDTHRLAFESKDGRLYLTFGEESPVSLETSKIALDTLQLTVRSTEGYVFDLSRADTDFSELDRAVAKGAKIRGGGAALREAYERAAHLSFAATQEEADAAAAALNRALTGRNLAIWLPVAAVLAAAAGVTVWLVLRKKKRAGAATDESEDRR